MNTMGQGLVITDATFHIEYVNPALARMLGEELDGLTGKPVRCLVMPADLGKLNVALAARAQGHAGTYEIRLQRTDGSLLDVLVNAVPRPMGGAIAVVTDLTERKQFEHQLVEALTAAEETVRRRTAFMATMSHEVRTPLTGIIGFASVLADELGPEQGEMAQIIKRSGERLLDTLNSVLDLARVEAGILHVTLEPVDVVAEVLDAARLFMPIAAQKGLLLRVQKPPCSVRASLNAVYLHRILCNLLSNAIKFTEAGGITVDVELIDDEVCIRVRDTGLGIDETFLPHLFQDFTQETPEPTQAHEGSGLGLAISQRLVECMNGRIEVASHKGQGSVFLVAFPCSAQPRHEPAAPEAALGPTLVT
jgi:PAS domain S-box-containing protein